MITSPALQAQLRPDLERLLDRLESPAVALRRDEWWAGLAPDLTERGPASTPDSSETPPALGESFPATIVAVDALRTTASPVAPLAEDGRLLFAEVVDGPGVAAFDVSGFLWSSGMSVIDIVRPVIESDGSWEFAIGIARHTPIRQNPAAAEAASKDD